MAMKYQKGTVYVTGKRIKMWYGQYLVYRRDQTERRYVNSGTFASVPRPILQSGKRSRCYKRSF